MTRIALALAVAAVSASAAAAQSNDPYAYLNNQLKAYEAKTVAPDPDAPTAAPADTRREPLAGNNNSLLDGCVITAIGRLPQVDGMRVVNTAYEHRSTSGKFDYWAVGVRVDYKGRQAVYQWICRVFDNVSAQLIANR